MRWYKWLLLFCPLFLPAHEPFFVTFDPPKEWVIAAPSDDQDQVKVGFIASKKKLFAPSISLSVEKIGTVDLTTYIAAVEKNYKKDRLNRFEKLGNIDIQQGKATLIQIDMKNHFGEIRLLQAITVYNGYAIIHSSAVLKEHFLATYESILSAFKSLSIYATVADSCQKSGLKEKIDHLTASWKNYQKTSKGEKETLFATSLFQENYWKPFVCYIENELSSQGHCWQLLAINHIKNTLLEGF